LFPAAEPRQYAPVPFWLDNGPIGIFSSFRNATDSVCALLSTNPEALYAHVEGILSQRQQAQQALAQLQTQQALAQADTLIQSALPCGEIRTAVGTFDSLPETALRELASKLIDQQSDLAVALFSKGAEKTLVVFACGKAVPFKMGNLLRETLAVFGGRGRWKTDFAMGSLPAKADIQEAAGGIRQKNCCIITGGRSHGSKVRPLYQCSGPNYPDGLPGSSLNTQCFPIWHAV
jgi:alanyl-tRNA synthetase